METSLTQVVEPLEEYLLIKTKKLDQFNSYKQQLEAQLKELESTIDICIEEIASTNKIIQTFNEQ